MARPQLMRISQDQVRHSNVAEALCSQGKRQRSAPLSRITGSHVLRVKIPIFLETKAHTFLGSLSPLTAFMPRNKRPRDFRVWWTFILVRGNEIAVQLAKERREKEQPPSHLSYREVKTLIHNQKKAIFHSQTGGHNPNQDALHQLQRHQQTTNFHLRTGHCRLNSHLKRIGVKTSAQCALWRSAPNIRTLPAILLTTPPSKAADMAHLRSPQNQALGVCSKFVPDTQVCGTHGREGAVNATITSNAEEEEYEDKSNSIQVYLNALQNPLHDAVKEEKGC